MFTQKLLIKRVLKTTVMKTCNEVFTPNKLVAPLGYYPDDAPPKEHWSYELYYYYASLIIFQL